MVFMIRFRAKATLALTSLIGGAVLASCAPASSPSFEAQAPTSSPAANQIAQQISAGKAAAPVADEAALSRSQPQLVKTAKLVLTVQSVQDGIDQAKRIVQQQQGDVLSLQEQTPTNERSRHTAALQLRVPQARLEAALQALKT